MLMEIEFVKSNNHWFSDSVVSVHMYMLWSWT